MHSSRGMVRKFQKWSLYEVLWSLLTKVMEQETGYQRWFRKLVESGSKIKKIVSFDYRNDFSRIQIFIDGHSRSSSRVKWKNIFSASLGRKFIRKYFFDFFDFLMNPFEWPSAPWSVEIRSHTAVYVIIWTTFRIDILRLTTKYVTISRWDLR